MNGSNRLSERWHDRLRLSRRWLVWTGILVGLSGGVALAAEGEVYTWKDSAGRVHYGNRPPEGQAAQPVELNAKPVAVQPTERIYTWTDAEGRIHYGARPPPDVPAKELKEDEGSLSLIRSGKLRQGEEQLLQNLQQR